MDIFLKDYSLTLISGPLMPFYSCYATKHWNASNENDVSPIDKFRHRLLAIFEYIPVIGCLISLAELGCASLRTRVKKIDNPQLGEPLHSPATPESLTFDAFARSNTRHRLDCTTPIPALNPSLAAKTNILVLKLKKNSYPFETSSQVNLQTLNITKKELAKINDCSEKKPKQNLEKVLKKYKVSLNSYDHVIIAGDDLKKRQSLLFDKESKTFQPTENSLKKITHFGEI